MSESIEAELVREQLQRERFQRAERDLTNALTARGYDEPDARRLATEARPRLDFGNDGGVIVTTYDGGRIKGDAGLSQLARQIRERQPTPGMVASQEERLEALVAEKRATGAYGM